MPPPSKRSNKPDTLTLIFRLISGLLQSSGRGVAAGRILVLGPVLLAVLTFGWYLFQPRERKEEVQQLVANYQQGHKHIQLTEVIWDIWSLYFSRSFIPTKVPVGANEIVFGGEPQRAAFPHAIQPLYNSAYVVGYCDALANPVWAAYRVFDLKTRPQSPPRPSGFEVDPRTSARVESGDYVSSGYDRGHMAPNYAIATRYGVHAQEETFLMSNVCPQRHTLNAGLWEQLEKRIADNLTGRFGQVWVLDGPIFGPEDRLQRIHNKVPVPLAFYMIIVQQHEGGVRAESFIMDQDTPERGAFEPYLTSIAEIERRTGLNFFPKLEKDAQSKLEAAQESRAW